MATGRGWSALIRGLGILGGIWVPLLTGPIGADEPGPPAAHPGPAVATGAVRREPRDTARRSGGGPPAGHPEGWSPLAPVPAADREVWAQISRTGGSSSWRRASRPR